MPAAPPSALRRSHDSVQRRRPRPADVAAQRRMAAAGPERLYERRISRAAVVGALELGVAVAIVLLIRATPATPVDAPGPPLETETVAASPASFRSQDVRVRGEVAGWPTRIKHRDQGTFVMKGTQGARLLVVPADAQRLRAFEVGTAVVVHGRVVMPPNSRRLRRRATSRTAVAERAGAPALIKATRVEYVG